MEESEEVGEDEVGHHPDEEDTRNMEDDSINLMLEDEDKMLEDEMTFNDSERLDHVSTPKFEVCSQLLKKFEV